MSVTDHVLPPFYILTGPPGAGKTTLLQSLCDDVATVPEAARRVLAEERITGGMATGEQDPEAFVARMAALQIKDYERASGPTLFDRGLPDLLAFCTYYRIADDAVRKATEVYRYSPQVFFLPPWEEIYQQDQERRLDFQGAKAFGALTRQGYLEMGYNLIEVPIGPVQARTDFVRARLGL